MISNEDLATIRWFESATDKWMDRPAPVSSHVAGALVRRGYLISTTQSERVRGERRTKWSIYKITLRGLALLKEVAPMTPQHLDATTPSLDAEGGVK